MRAFREVSRVLGLASLVGLGGVAAAQVSVTTYHNDNLRTGQNNSETALTTSNVNQKTFGLLFNLPVDGYVYAQPLYLPGLAMPNRGTHNVVYIATEHNSVYAFDADSNSGANAQPLWHVNFGGSVPSADVSSWDIQPEIGITSTPVILPAQSGVAGATPTLYVESKTKALNASGQAVYTHELHALDATTGAEKYGGPVVVQGTVRGTGDGTNGLGSVPFNPLIQNCRAGLLALTSSGVGLPAVSPGLFEPATGTGVGGTGSTTIYLGYASHGDNGPYHGWVFAYNATTLQQVGIYNTSPNAKTDPSGYPIAAGGIWQGGGGLASDGTSLFYSTGNGTFSPGTGAYGDSIVRMNLPGLTIADYFTPSDQQYLDDNDIDLGSGAIMLLPKGAGSASYPSVAVQSGKEGTLYLLNTGNLGGYGTSDHVVQELPYVMGGIWGSPAYFNGNIYYGPQYSSLLAIPIANAAFTANGPNAWSPTYYSYPGPTPSISSNGTANGIVWAIQSDGGGPNGSAVLHAYLASNIGTELYNSAATNGRDTLGGPVKFSTPTIANGKVYCGNAYSVGVFGLGRWVATPTINPSSGNYPNSVKVSVTDATANASIYYTTDGSTPTQQSTQYTGPVTFTTSVTFTARAFATGYGPSAQAQDLYQINAVIGNGRGLWGQYFNNFNPANAFPPVTASRLDPTIDFDWNSGSPIAGVAADNWAASWRGQIQAETTSTYTFYTLSDDGVRVWVDGQELINDWTYHGATWDSGTVNLRAGQKYNIQINYFQGGGADLVHLYWSAPGMAFQVVPTSQLYPPAGH